MLKCEAYFPNSFSLNFETSVLTKPKLRATSLNSCSPGRLQRLLRHASHIPMKSRGRDYAKKATSTIDSGKHSSWCGRKKERRDCTVVLRRSSLDKFQTRQSWWQLMKRSSTCCPWSSMRPFISTVTETEIRMERVSSWLCTSRKNLRICFPLPR